MNNDKSNLEITHLLYVDDSLIFCDAKVEQVTYLGLILIVFEAISSLHVNRRKSRLFTVNDVPNVQRLAGSLGYGVGVLPTIYLGLP